MPGRTEATVDPTGEVRAGSWEIGLLMNAHSHRPEPLP